MTSPLSLQNVDFIDDQNAAAWKAYTLLPEGKETSQEVETLFDLGLDTIMRKMSQCDTEDTFIRDDIVVRWNLNRHYPFLQPTKKPLSLVPQSYLEYVDFLKSLQYHITVTCDYYRNTAQQKNVPLYDTPFIQVRETSWRVVDFLKMTVAANATEPLVRSGSSKASREAGLEGALADKILRRAWTKTGNHCRASTGAGNARRFDFLAYQWYKEEGGEGEYLPQCSISGSSNAVLSTFLWLMDAKKVRKRDLARVMLTTIVMLVLDGGHTVQECIAAFGVMACIYGAVQYIYQVEKHEPRTGIFTNLDVLKSILTPIHFFPTPALTLSKLDYLEAAGRIKRTFEIGRENAEYESEALVLRDLIAHSLPVSATIKFSQTGEILKHLARVARV
jgi:hypothetical protein